MKTFYSILPSFALGFDCICIVLAGIYTFQQLYTYVRNEDSSEISFQKFTDDSSSRNYPTYTICFEDQEQHHIYNTEPISTFDFNRRIEFNPKRCPCGCHVQREGNRLRLLNQECPEYTETIHHSYSNLRPPLFDENGNPNPYHFSYDPGFPSTRTDNCNDTAYGATDIWLDDCDWYLRNENNREKCGFYDDYDFKAKSVCCACGGIHCLRISNINYIFLVNLI